MPADVDFDVLQSRYADDDEDDIVVVPTHTSPAPPAAHALPLDFTPKVPASVPDVEEQLLEEEDDDYDSDNELAAALEWADMTEGGCITVPMVLSKPALSV